MLGTTACTAAGYRHSQPELCLLLVLLPARLCSAPTAPHHTHDVRNEKPQAGVTAGV
jgi:hypothetical protein